MTQLMTSPQSDLLMPLYKALAASLGKSLRPDAKIPPVSGSKTIDRPIAKEISHSKMALGPGILKDPGFLVTWSK